MSIPELPGSVRSLLDVGVALLRRSASGKVLLARYAPLVEDAALPAVLREPVRAELDAARAAAVVPFKGPDKSPVAITPTAQVHRRDGQAVKVARPGVAATVRSELALVDALVGPVRMLVPAADVRALFAEVREAVMDELDLEHEGETQSRLRRTLRRLDGVTVPAVELEDCDEATLVSEWLEGEHVTELSAEDAELLIAAHLVAWRDAGLAPTDARPSHLLRLPDGTLGLLGLGLARPVDRDRLQPFLDAFAALADDDAAAFAAALDALGLLPADAATRAHGLIRAVLGPFVQGEATLDAAAVHDVSVRAFEHLSDFLALGTSVTPDARDLAAARMAGQLAATLARFQVTADWPALVARAAQAG